MARQPWPDVPLSRRTIMRSNKAKDTTPELEVRRLLHALGYRFRLHRRDLPGTPDVVFPGRRKAVQVYGCFWHQHDGCRRATQPATRRDFWLAKFARNKQRDREASAALEALGWHSTVVWECELSDKSKLAQRLQCFLGAPQAPSGPQEGSKAKERPS